VRILAIGDITSQGGVSHLERTLWAVRRKYGVDLCVVNAENASFIVGVGPDAAEVLLRSGADVITGGNHTLQNFAARDMLDEVGEVLRPINYPRGTVGHGSVIVNTGACRALVISAMGNVHIDPVLDSPYSYIEEALKENSGKYDVAVLDIHAEATGEKLAVAHSFDGRIAVIFGTHTHVATADATVLPGGTGYVTDLGMCGESGGIMGIEVQSVLRKLRDGIPGRFVCAEGKPVADGVIFTLDSSYKCTEIKRIKF
jgi:metallophosphoesterase (TIGR00282 family)